MLLNLKLPFLFIATVLCTVSTRAFLAENNNTIFSNESEDSPKRSFKIDYDRNTFLKDGKPFRYISGSVHYFRIVPERWDDILNKVYLSGLNAVQTYVEWASHQPTASDNYNFNGNLDLIRFIETAQRNNLQVILRPGPFIDAERDMGGLPPWLLWQSQNMELRTSDPEYLFYVTTWYQKLLPMIRPYLYENGGPIIMIQVENEYGSYYACDHKYTTFMRDLIRHYLGDSVVLFTTDGSSVGYLKCGAVADVYPTIDFGTVRDKSSIEGFFNAQRTYAPKGPLVNSEYYPGWLDHWQYPHSTVSTEAIIESLDYMLDMGANVNFYMFHGGTSFGLGAGSNQDGDSFTPCPTSYDYDAPLNEAGDPTLKYWAIKHLISKYKGVPTQNPSISSKLNLGKVPLKPFASLFDSQFLRMVSSGSAVQAENPKSFEDLKIGSGFVLYETTIPFDTTDPAVLSAPSLKDRAYVYSQDLNLLTVLSRSQRIFSAPIHILKGDKLSILVENQGRPCYGRNLNESKGLGDTVTLGGQSLTNWTMYRIDNLDGSMLQKYAQTVNVPASAPTPYLSARGGAGFYTGTFTISNSTDLQDTFIRLDGWKKGLAWVNNFNLGRYWPIVGPQQTLYLPGPILRHGMNFITVFELEGSPQDCTRFYGRGANNNSDDPGRSCYVTLTDRHVINGTTPLKADVAETMLKNGLRLHGKEWNEARDVVVNIKADLGIRKQQ